MNKKAAQMSQEELFTRKYIARLKWIEEENRRANGEGQMVMKAVTISAHRPRCTLCGWICIGLPGHSSHSQNP